MRVGSDQVDDFRRDGAIAVRNLADQPWLDRLSDAIDANHADPGPYRHDYTVPDAAGGFWGDYCNWQRFEAYGDFALGSGVAELAAQVMVSDEVRFFHEHVLVKEPGTAEVTPWHHDQPYYCIDGDQVCSIWLSLDRVPADSGLVVVAGSHRGGYHLPRKFLTAEPYWQDHETTAFTPVPDIDALLELDADDPNRPRLLTFDIEPGDAIVFHMRALHTAPGTTGLAGRRRAFTTRWLGDDAVYAVRPGETSPPLTWLPDRGQQVGQPLRHPEFPVAWPPP